MTLDVRPQKLFEELAAAERVRDQHLESLSPMLQRYHGPHYRGQPQEEAFYPENHYYEYVSLMVPRLVYDNPRVRVSTRRPGSQKKVAEAMRHGLNRWARDTNYRRPLARVAVDTLFAHGVMLTTETSSTSQHRTGEQAIWPQCYRISPRHFGRDPQALHDDECRFMFHLWHRDKDSLLKEAEANPDAGWNLSFIREIAEDTGLDKLGHDKRQDFVMRDEIVAYEVWIPEYVLPESPGAKEGFHGTLFTLGVTQPVGSTSGLDDKYTPNKVDFLRAPRPYYGPRWGPYTTFGVYTVPDSPYPLSPLAAVEGQIQDLNQHVQAASHNAASFKKVVFVDASDKKLAQQIKDAEDMFVIPVNGLDRQKVVVAELGGISAQQIEYIKIARDRLDRNSGVDDAQRGATTGSGTATEHAIADEAAATRMGFIRQQFADGAQRALQSVAWYLYHDDRVVFPLGEEAAEEMMLREPWFEGGSHKEGSGATFEDLELEIEPFSMQRASEAMQQRLTLQMTEMVAGLAPAVVQFPFIDWKAVFNRLGDALNIPDLADVVDTEKAAEQAQAIMAAGQPQQGGGQGGQPRLSRDAGQTGLSGFRFPVNTSGGGGGGQSQQTLSWNAKAGSNGQKAQEAKV